MVIQLDVVMSPSRGLLLGNSGWLFCGGDIDDDEGRGAVVFDGRPGAGGPEEEVIYTKTLVKTSQRKKDTGPYLVRGCGCSLVSSETWVCYCRV